MQKELREVQKMLLYCQGREKTFLEATAKHIIQSKYRNSSPK